jgi:hypothetical protein
MSNSTASAPMPEEAKIRPIMQVLFIVVSATIIWSLLSTRLNRYSIEDPEPPIFNVTPEIYKSFGGFPDTIQIGLYITQFRTFNIITGEFDFEGIIWFEFNPDILSLQTLEKFIFKNGDIVSKSSPDTQIVNDKLLVRYTIRVKCTSPLNYASFPIDNHTLQLVVANHFISPSTALFSSSAREFIIKAQTRSFGWERINRSVTTGIEKTEIDLYNEHKTSYFPIAIFAIDYARYGIRYTLSIMLPLLLIFYLTLFSLSWGKGGGLNMAIGGITATLGYRFVIENLSPKVGYFMLSDYIFFLFLTCNALTFLINIIDAYARPFNLKEKFASLIALHAVVIVACVYLFIFWQ